MFKVVGYAKLIEDFNEFVKSVREAHLRKEIEERDRKLHFDVDKIKKTEHKRRIYDEKRNNTGIVIETYENRLKSNIRK